MKAVIHPVSRSVLFFLISLLFTGIFLFTGCLSQKVKDITYYVLEYQEYPDLVLPEREEPYPETVLVEDAVVTELYNRKELVWRGEGPVVGYFDFHHWGIRLTQMASDLISKTVEKTGFFSSVNRKYTVEKADNIILPVIERVEMVKGTEEEFAKLRLEMELQWHSSTSMDPLFRYAVAYERELSDKEQSTFVIIVNRLILEATGEFLEELEAWKENSGGGT